MIRKIKERIKNGEYGITSSGIDYDIFVNDETFFVVVSTQCRKVRRKNKKSDF